MKEYKGLNHIINQFITCYNKDRNYYFKRYVLAGFNLSISFDNVYSRNNLTFFKRSTKNHGSSFITHYGEHFFKF